FVLVAIAGAREQPQEVRVGRVLRGAATWTMAYAIGFGALWVLTPEHVVANGAVVFGVVTLVFIMVWILRAPVGTLLAPFRGRLLDAAEEARRGLAVADSLDAVAQAVLVPLRRASGRLDA